MKKYLPILFLLLTHFSTQAQNRANIWYFGSNAGIDFNSGSPVSLNNGALSTAEGCASICDTNGNLLFYTSGATVYNANHQIMSNGNNLHGQSSSSQSSLIVPLPGSDSIYYLFTTAEQAGSWGLQYSIIDMSLQSGLGEVTDKNLPLVSPVGEKLTAVQQTGTNNIWVVTHEYYTANFYSYLLTDTGLNATPVVTTVGSVHSGFGTDNAIGYMKISPDGTKITAALSRSDEFELFDFDASTGIPSNPLVLPVSNYSYGLEYSANSRILYTAEFNNKIYQYDLYAGSAADILASKLLIGQPIGIEIGSIQMAPDGKIYVVKNSSTSLGVIENPDTLGMNCDFVDDAFSISPNTGIEGLPNFMSSFFNELPPSPVSALSVSDTDVCEKFCVGFTDLSTNNPTSWHWIFEGGSPDSSDIENPSTVCYDEPGTFDVTLITTNSYGSDTIILSDFITVYPTPAFPTITQNGYTLTSSAGDSYQWQLDAVDISGATNQSYEAMQTGFYTVVVSDSNGCQNSTTLYVEITGIDELSDENISIYPNPSNGDFEIQLVGNSSASKISLAVLNTLGQEIFSEQDLVNSLNWKKKIDLNNVPDGAYYIEIKSDLGFASRKFTIIK